MDDGRATSPIDSDRFVIKHTLGSGGAGVVYRARDRARHHDVAIKTLRSNDGRLLYQFKREFRSLAGIIHPNLVTLYELHAVGELWMFSMELVDGGTFLEHVRPFRHLMHDRTPSGSDGTEPTVTVQAGTGDAPGLRGVAAHRHALRNATLEPGRLADAVAQLVEAIAALHAAGKLHRDVKPSNVLVDRHGRVVVCDFGLIQELSNASEAKGRVLGTPSYMSPEQAAGATLCEATDWYSVGVMIYEALTGMLPFAGSYREVRDRKQVEDPAPPSDHGAVDTDWAELCMALIDRDPAKRPGASAILERLGKRRTQVAIAPPATSDSAAPPFVGRDAHLEALRRAFGDTRAGRGVAVLAHGASGIGKSRLIREFVDQLGGGDLVLLEGRCYERETVPYKALDSLVDALSNHLMALDTPAIEQLVSQDIGALARVFPVLRRVGALAALIARCGVPSDPHQLRRRAFAALRHVLERIAARHPTVLFIDDLQWGDVDSAAFLADLIESQRDVAALLIVTYRSDEADSSPILRRLLGANARRPASADVRELAVSALTPHEARELARVSLAARGATVGDANDRAVDIAAEAAGNPMLVDELARAHDGDTKGSEGLHLDDVLRARIARLPEDARRMLATSAVAGRPLPVGMIGGAARVTDQAATLATLQAERLVRTRRAENRETLEPYHDRIREVATAGLDHDAARDVHRRLARAFEATTPLDANALVQHWLGAGDRTRAGSYASAAAEIAERALAFDQAASSYRQALELLELAPEPRRRMLGKLGDALALAGKLGDAADAFLRAADGADLQRATALRTRALEVLLRAGSLTEGLDVADQVARAVGVKGPSTHRHAVATALAQRAGLALRGLRFRERAPAECDPMLLTRRDVCWAISSGLAFSHIALGLVFHNRQLTYALRAGEPGRVALALIAEIGFLSVDGAKARDRMENLAVRARELLERHPRPGALGFLHASRGLAHYLSGEFVEARDLLARGEQQMREDVASFGWQIDTTRVFELAALLNLGRIDELARRMPDELRAATDRHNEYLGVALRTWRLNTLWLALDDVDQAREHAAAISRMTSQTEHFHLHHFFELITFTSLGLYEGDALGARARVEQAWPALKRSLLLFHQFVRVEAESLRGRCALAAAAATPGQRRRLVRAARKSAGAIERRQAAWGTPHASLLRAGAAAIDGEDDAAVELLSRAVAGFEHTHQDLLAAVSRLRRGELVGGDAGDRDLRDARAWLRAQSVADPDRIAALLAPGFGSTETRRRLRAPHADQLH